MPEKPLSYRETFQMRRNYLGKSCKLHFEVAPLKVVRASKQYMYDDSNIEYLDCISNVSHVGHCHPHVVNAGQEQMAKLTTSNGFLNEAQSKYARRLAETLPEQLCVCFFVNSGSEANDLALRLAKAHTKKEDIVVVQNAYHGNLGNLIDISPLRFRDIPNGQKPSVHVVPCPDTYRGIYKEDAANPGQLYADEVKQVIDDAHASGRKIAAFMCDPFLLSSGFVVPPQNYLKNVYRYIREAGGVCIADEVQVGLGRPGDAFWAFQTQDVVPDIITIGKPLGNGHPMAALFTTKEIADSLGDQQFSSSYGGNPVACSIGLAVLDVISNEKLQSAAKMVGRCLMDGFNAIQDKHPMMGNIRGLGLIIGIELVQDKTSRKPAKEAAELLAYKMKQEHIIIANDGPDKNIMFVNPPMCFNTDNARTVVKMFDRLLAEIESGVTGDSSIGQNSITKLQIPLEALDDTNVGGEENSDDDGEPSSKRGRFEEMD